MNEKTDNHTLGTKLLIFLYIIGISLFILSLGLYTQNVNMVMVILIGVGMGYVANRVHYSPSKQFRFFFNPKEREEGNHFQYIIVHLVILLVGTLVLGGLLVSDFINIKRISMMEVPITVGLMIGSIIFGIGIQLSGSPIHMVWKLGAGNIFMAPIYFALVVIGIVIVKNSNHMMGLSSLTDLVIIPTVNLLRFKQITEVGNLNLTDSPVLIVIGIILIQATIFYIAQVAIGLLSYIRRQTANKNRRPHSKKTDEEGEVSALVGNDIDNENNYKKPFLVRLWFSLWKGAWTPSLTFSLLFLYGGYIWFASSKSLSIYSAIEYNMLKCIQFLVPQDITNEDSIFYNLFSKNDIDIMNNDAPSPLEHFPTLCIIGMLLGSCLSSLMRLKFPDTSFSEHVQDLIDRAEFIKKVESQMEKLKEHSDFQRPATSKKKKKKTKKNNKKSTEDMEMTLNDLNPLDNEELSDASDIVVPVDAVQAVDTKNPPPIVIRLLQRIVQNFTFLLGSLMVGVGCALIHGDTINHYWGGLTSFSLHGYFFVITFFFGQLIGAWLHTRIY